MLFAMGYFLSTNFVFVLLRFFVFIFCRCCVANENLLPSNIESELREKGLSDSQLLSWRVSKKYGPRSASGSCTLLHKSGTRRQVFN